MVSAEISRWGVSVASVYDEHATVLEMSHSEYHQQLSNCRRIGAPFLAESGTFD